MLQRIVISVVVGFLFGIGLGTFTDLPLTPVILILLFGFTALSLYKGQASPLLIYAVLMLLGFGAGLIRLQMVASTNTYENKYGRDIDTYATVVGDVTRNTQKEEITVLPQGNRQKIKITLFRNFSYAETGDRVWIRGELRAPKNFSNFDYVNYLRRQSIYAELARPRITVIKRGGFSVAKLMQKIREQLSSKAGKTYVEPTSYLVMGVLLGQKKELPEEVKSNFSAVGLTHILAVSGYNMSIVATLCVGLAWYIGRRWTNLLTLLLIWSFTLLVGMGASVIRAAIMASLVSIAQLLGRSYSGIYVLLLTGALMILQKPAILVGDVGFQLSFAATFGVMGFSRLWLNKEAGFFRDSVITTSGAILLTTPIISAYFGIFSLAALVANLLVLPLVPLFMLFAFLGLLPVIGYGPAKLAEFISQLILWVAKFFAGQTWSVVHINLPQYCNWLFFIFAVCVLTLLIWRKSGLSGTI